MQRIPWLAAALTLGLLAPASAQTIGSRPFAKGTRVTVIGEITSQPRDFGLFREKKVQVAVGPNRTDHTLHLRDARILGVNGRERARSDLRDKMWVRAEGWVGDDPRRIDVDRLQIVGRNFAAYRSSPFFRSDMAEGYVITESVAGEREVFESTKPFRTGQEVVVVAPISSQPKKGGIVNEHKLQVAIGPDKTDYTLHLKDARLYGRNGGEIGVTDLRDRMWLRAEGRVMEDARRIDVRRLEVIATDKETYLHGQYFRTGGELGYIIGR
jgi:hypothetical protein